MKILAAIDLSDASQIILEKVKALGSGLSAEVCLVHVAEPSPGFIGYVGNEPGYIGLEPCYIDYGPDPKTTRSQIADKFHKEHKALQKEAGMLRRAGIEATALLIQGPIIDVILSRASKLGADIIIVGSHGHGAVYNLVIGSVSEGILKRSPCPVLVIPTHKRGKIS